MSNKKSRLIPTRRALIFWCLFIGIGAVGGALCMLIRPDGSIMGMQEMLPYFKKLPLADLLYRDFVFPGIALLCINGIPNLIAAYLLLKKKKAGLMLATIFGVTLMLWISIQFYIFAPNFMSTSYFIFGLVQFFTGIAALTFYEQERFTVNTEDYKNIGTNKERIVVYFSRMGYTKKLAFEEAERSGADIIEIKSAEPTEGTSGFWWCGRYGMHRWPMPIEEIGIDLSRYKHVTICSPIWVFHLSAPVREFCRHARGKICEVDYILCHHMKCSFENAAREADELLSITHTDLKSVCCRKGRYL